MADLGKLHEELLQVPVVGRELVEVLAEITSIARRSIPGADAVSIPLIRGEQPYTAGHDEQMALEADELQYERGYGPCMDAALSGEVFLIDDMASEQRWPDYAHHAAAQGVCSSLSVPLPFQAATTGGLNNYAADPHAFGEDDVAIAVEVATWMAYAVANASAAASATMSPRVDRFARVTVRHAQCSVPVRLIGRQVRVHLGSSSVAVFDGRKQAVAHERVVARRAVPRARPLPRGAGPQARRPARGDPLCKPVRRGRSPRRTTRSGRWPARARRRCRHPRAGRSAAAAPPPCCRRPRSRPDRRGAAAVTVV